MIRIRIRFELDLHLHSRVFIGTTRRGSFVSGLSRNRVGIASFFKFIVFNGRPYLSLFSWAGINASSEIFRKNIYYIHFLRSHRKFFYHLQNALYKSHTADQNWTCLYPNFRTKLWTHVHQRLPMMELGKHVQSLVCKILSNTFCPACFCFKIVLKFKKGKKLTQDRTSIIEDQYWIIYVKISTYLNGKKNMPDRQIFLIPSFIVFNENVFNVCVYGVILKPRGPLGGGGFMKSPRKSTRGEGGYWCCPRGPNY